MTPRSICIFISTTLLIVSVATQTTSSSKVDDDDFITTTTTTSLVIEEDTTISLPPFLFHSTEKNHHTKSHKHKLKTTTTPPTTTATVSPDKNHHHKHHHGKKNRTAGAHEEVSIPPIIIGQDDVIQLEEEPSSTTTVHQFAASSATTISPYKRVPFCIPSNLTLPPPHQFTRRLPIQQYNSLTKCMLGKGDNITTCSTWAINVVVVLKPNTPFAQLQLIKGFLDEINLYCEDSTTVSVFAPGDPNRECRNSSIRNPQFLDSLGNVSNFTVQSSYQTYSTLRDLYQQQLECSGKDPSQLGGLTLVFTNSDCRDYCIRPTLEPIPGMNNISSIPRWTKLYYSGDWSENCPTDARSIFNTMMCEEQEKCFYEERSLDYLLYDVTNMQTCPSKGYNTIELLVIIGIPCLTMIIIALGLAYLCYKKSNIRWRKFFLKEQLQKQNLTVEDMQALSEGVCPTTGQPLKSPPNSPALTYKESFAPKSPKWTHAQQNVYSDHFTECPEEDLWEITPGHLLILENKILGHGAFATVYKGMLTGRIPLIDLKPGLKLELCQDGEDEYEVAIKRLPPHADIMARKDFEHEIEFMKSLGYHRHVTSLLGYVTTSADPFLVVEFCHYGDLLRFLRSQKKNAFVGDGEDCPIDAEMCLRVKDLVSISWQIADGMSYLSSLNFIHRDLAARNVLLTKTMVAKISDFGLGRHVDSTLYMAKGGRLPLKWMPPEALKYNEFSQKSDVWSFGILLYEMFSLGKTPFPTVQPFEIVDHLESGGRPPQPSFCPVPIYALQKWCWQLEASNRPTFEEIKIELTALLNANDANYGYIDLRGSLPDRGLHELMEQTMQNDHDVIFDEENPPNEEIEDEKDPTKCDDVEWMYLEDRRNEFPQKRMRSATDSLGSSSTISEGTFDKIHKAASTTSVEKKKGKNNNSLAESARSFLNALNPSHHKSSSTSHKVERPTTIDLEPPPKGRDRRGSLPFTRLFRKTDKPFDESVVRNHTGSIPIS